MLIRWLKFNAVGAAGVVVQIGALWILVECGTLQCLLATIVATELAVIHNFVWHTRWTWADRPVSVAQSIGRLVRFNLTNGAVSLIGSVILMAALTGVARVPYLVANMIAIATCSLLNFALSEKMVFGRQALDYGPCEATAGPKA
jgi:putative flippase GtrA